MFFILESIEKEIPTVSTILIYGGKSSSKTYTVAQRIAKKCIEERRDAILFRKETARVKLTVKRTIVSAIKSLRLQNGFTVLDFLIRSASDGTIFMTGLDNEDKAKGAEGLSYVLMDELDQFNYEEFNQVEMSFRGDKAKILFGTWNPVSKNSWVKKDLVDSYQWVDTKYTLPNPESFVKISSCKSVVLIKTNFKDNYWTVGSPCGEYGFRDEKLIVKYNKLKKKNYNAYKINVLGEWGNVSKGGEFYKKFQAEKHVIDRVPYDPNKPLHLSFDENTSPYLSLSIYQGEGLKTWKIDEICLEHPKNTLKDTLKVFKDKYPPNKETVYIYGDRTSLKADSKLEKGQNFFTIIEKSLSEYITKRRLPTKNPNVSSRGNFINEIFESNHYGIEFYICENCTKSIDDYENVKEASDGTKLKQRIKDPVTKISYEPYGHLSDTDDYFICEYYKLEYKKYLGMKKRGMVSAPINNST